MQNLYNCSLVVPLYQGKKYIHNIIRMVNNNSRLFDKGMVELILVNDFPDEIIDEYEIGGLLCENVSFSLINNKVNEGIHYSRIIGMKKSKAKYVMFLDQDDVIADDCLISHLEIIKNSDMTLSNGYYEYNSYIKPIYKNKVSFLIAKSIWFNSELDCRIVSPGQCMIKKESIPQYWIDNKLLNNGSDDYMLWLLMMSEKKKLTLVNKFLYTHKNTGDNLSLNLTSITKSCREVVEKLQGIINPIYIKLIERRLDTYESGKSIIEFRVIDGVNSIVARVKHSRKTRNSRYYE